MGAFREDLYYRVSALRFSLAPLRERRKDASEIAAHTAARLGSKLSRSAADWVEGHSWPGNVRQVVHATAVAAEWARSRGGKIDGSHFASLPGGRSAAGGSNLPVGLFTAREYAVILNVPLRTAQRRLAAMVDQGVVDRSGAGRATVYLRSLGA